MKKVFALILALCMVLTLLPVTASAATVDSGQCGDNATWTLDDEGTLTISGTGAMWDYDSRYTSTKAPWRYDVLKKSVYKVKVEPGITHIGQGAFSDLTDVKEVSLPDTVTSFGNGALSYMYALKAVTLPKNIREIPYSLFSNSAIETIEIPSGVTSIGEHAFYTCTKLKEIVIPESVTSIGHGAFDSCYDLTSAKLSSRLTEIPDRLFHGCHRLYEVELPPKLQFIGEMAFADSGLTLVEIPDTVTEIESSAFMSCRNLYAAYLPQGISTISKFMFQSCDSLTTLIWHPGIKTVERNAFNDCDALEIIYFTGRAEQLQEIIVYENNDPLFAADFYLMVICTQQPKSQTVPEGSIAHFSVKTSYEGTDAAYQWYYLPAGGDDWQICNLPGSKTDRLSVPAELSRDGQSFRCAISVPGMTTFYSDAAVLTIGEVPDVQRLAGSDRFDTAFKSADALKEVMGVDKFPAAIVTSGMNFADALAGSYLAARTGAPILLTNNDNMDDVIAYIRENVEVGGTVYALGGSTIVSDALQAVSGSGYIFKRLAGASRFETNLMILEEAGIDSGDPVLVCTAYNFADSLSASALGLPILLVGDTVSDAQMAFLNESTDGEFVLVGGTGAVTAAVERTLEGMDGYVVRLAGASRFETSAMLADEVFGGSVENAVFAYGYNFPDGLCAGPLAYALGAPLILTANGDEAAAADYVSTTDIFGGFVLGGPTLISDEAVNKIFGLDYSWE